MAGQNQSHATGKIWGMALIFLALLAIGCAVFLAMRPALFSFVSTNVLDVVSIVPQDAVEAGAEWRLVSQWRKPGESGNERNISVVEFKHVPGWETPQPIVLKQDERNQRIEGTYKPAVFSEQTILTVAGESSLAQRLVPELARLYLLRIGAGEVRRIPGKNAEENTVQGIFYATSEIRSIRIEGKAIPSGWGALRQEGYDVVLAAGRLSDQQAMLKEDPTAAGMTRHAVGLDAVVLVVHRDNPVAALSLEQIHKIFSGEIASWDQVGGPAVPIKVFALQEGSGTRWAFDEFFMAGRNLAQAARLVDSQEMLSDLVAQDPLAVGFCSRAFAGQCREVPLKVMPDVAPVAPTAQSIASLSYPAFRNLYFLLSMESKNIYARDFLDMVLGSAGQETVRKFGFVSLLKTPAISAQHEGGGRASMASAGPLPPLVQLDGEVVTEAARRDVLLAYREGVSGAQRLQSVFRFDAASINPDREARAEVDRMARFMQRRENAGKQLILVGFSDSPGDYASNLAASRKRAEAIANEFRSRGIQALVLAAGEEDPLESNETKAGREKNRRVELWMR